MPIFYQLKHILILPQLVANSLKFCMFHIIPSPIKTKKAETNFIKTSKYWINLYKINVRVYSKAQYLYRILGVVKLRYTYYFFRVNNKF